MAQPDRLQLGKPLAAAGAAEEDRELVSDQFAAAAGEEGRQAGQACSVLLADAGREPSHAAVVRAEGPANRSAGGGGWGGGGGWYREIRRPGAGRPERVWRKHPKD